MKKLDELANPKSCMNRAHDNEMTFVLLGRDLMAPAVISGVVPIEVSAWKELSERSSNHRSPGVR